MSQHKTTLREQETGIRRCSYCGRFLSIKCFYNNRDYLRSSCNRCISVSNYIKYNKTKEYYVVYRETHREIYKDKKYEYDKNYRKDNVDLIKYYRALYRMKKRNSTAFDSTADKEKIKEIYGDCYELNQLYGYVRYHVDHVHPVSKGGKHHQDNLQILRATDNMKKSNKVSDHSVREPLSAIEREARV